MIRFNLATFLNIVSWVLQEVCNECGRQVEVLMESFPSRGTSICVVFSSTEHPLLSPSCSRQDQAEHGVEGYDFSTGAAPIFAKSGVYSSGTCKQTFLLLSLPLAGLEQSLGKGELSVLLTSRYFRRFECFLAIRWHAEMMELHLPMRLH